MGTGTCLKGIEIVEKLEAIFLVLFGEIFELSYHCRMLDPRHKNSRIRVIQQYKWTIVIHLFLVFLSVIVWPIQTIVIFCLISQLLTTENHPSQLEKSETLPKLLVQSNQRLKFFCVSHQK